MLLRTTAKIKIAATPEIIRTIKVYSKALQFCVNRAWKYKIKNNIKLHKFVYRDIKNKGLQSQLVIACIKQACEMVKKAKSKPIIKRTSMRYNFPRSFSLKNNILSIATIKRRIKIPFTIPDCYKKYFSWDITESLLRIDEKGRCFFLFSFSKKINPKSFNLQERALGVDLGINNLAVTSDNQFFNSSKVKNIKRKFRYLRSKLQSKGTRSCKRLLKKLSGRENRWMKWINHNISKQIISNFNGNKIVMEDLKGIRKLMRGRNMNYWINNWSFHQLQSFIKYKAERIGVSVIQVKPNYTSQICHRCGKLGYRSSGCFNCFHCGLFSYSADLNAARNLAHPKLVERQADVTLPHISNRDSKANINGIADEFRDKHQI